MNLKHAICKVTPAPIIRWGKWALDASYRRRSQEIVGLKAMPRYQPTVVNFMEKPLEIIDAPSFLDMYEEIFDEQIYRFKTSQPTPYIIDGGANIGLSILYFKSLHPDSQIVAFEADEQIFEVLKRNIQGWGYDDVDLNCCALWSSETSLSFMSEGTYAGRLSVARDRQDRLTRTVRLRGYLDRPVSLLKLDIEGAETEVLKDCADLLCNAENVFVEYHSFPDMPQTLDLVLNILTAAGFRFHIHAHSHSPQPLIKRTLAFGMDMQLNIYAYR